MQYSYHPSSSRAVISLSPLLTCHDLHCTTSVSEGFNIYSNYSKCTFIMYMVLSLKSLASDMAALRKTGRESHMNSFLVNLVQHNCSRFINAIELIVFSIPNHFQPKYMCVMRLHQQMYHLLCDKGDAQCYLPILLTLQLKKSIKKPFTLHRQSFHQTDCSQSLRCHLPVMECISIAT